MSIEVFGDQPNERECPAVVSSLPIQLEGGVMRIKLAAFLLTLCSLALALVPCQLSRASNSGTRTNTVYQFVEIETTVHVKGVETSSAHPNERRWYLSNVIVQPEDVATY